MFPFGHHRLIQYSTLNLKFALSFIFENPALCEWKVIYQACLNKGGFQVNGKFCVFSPERGYSAVAERGWWQFGFSISAASLSDGSLQWKHNPTRFLGKPMCASWDRGGHKVWRWKELFFPAVWSISWPAPSRLSCFRADVVIFLQYDRQTLSPALRAEWFFKWRETEPFLLDLECHGSYYHLNSNDTGSPKLFHKTYINYCNLKYVDRGSLKK